MRFQLVPLSVETESPELAQTKTFPEPETATEVGDFVRLLESCSHFPPSFVVRTSPPEVQTKTVPSGADAMAAIISGVPKLRSVGKPVFATSQLVPLLLE